MPKGTGPIDTRKQQAIKFDLLFYAKGDGAF